MQMNPPLVFGLWVQCPSCEAEQCLSFGIRNNNLIGMGDFTEDTWSMFIQQCKECNRPLFPIAYAECVSLRDRMEAVVSRFRERMTIGT